MGNSKASSVAPLPAAERSASIELAPEQSLEQSLEPRDFHFAVTWIGLFARLELIEATGPRTQVGNPLPSLALVPVVVSPPLVEQQQDYDSSAGWEMVVPKMIRTGPRTFVPAEDVPQGRQKPGLL